MALAITALLIHRLQLVTLVLISTALLSGCPTQTKRVLVIGDSITFPSADELTYVGAFVVDSDPSYRMNFTVLASPGIGARNTVGDPDEYWSGLISNSIQPGNFDAVVVELGGNDCRHVSARGDFVQDVARINSAISDADPDVPVFWVNLPDYSQSPGCAAVVNGDLAQIIELGTYPKLASFDYGTWARANQECFSDGIHLREPWRKDPSSGGANLPEPRGYCNGQLRYAKWLKAQLDEFFGPRG